MMEPWMAGLLGGWIAIALLAWLTIGGQYR